MMTLLFGIKDVIWQSFVSKTRTQLEDRSQKKKIMFLHSKNKASRKGYNVGVPPHD